MVYVHCLLMSLMVHLTLTSRILIIPTPVKSHTLQMATIGEALVKRGHSVSIYLPSYFSFNVLKQTSLDIIKYTTTEEYEDMYNHTIVNYESDIWQLNSVSTLQFLRIVANISRSVCLGAVSDRAKLNLLRTRNFDIAIVDAFILCKCLFAIPYYLNVPTAAFSSHIDVMDSGAPFQPNNYPIALLPYDGYMNFFQRIVNILTHSTIYFLLPSVTVTDMSEVDDVFKGVRVDTLIQKAQLYLEHSDYALDNPKATFSNFVHIGGLTPKPASPLPSTFEKFVASAEDGIVVVSFGSVSLLEHAPKHMFDNMMAVLSQLKMKVIRRGSTDYEEGNTKVSKWLPQNDILGHPNTKLFISHCGKNGIFESIYHAVPIVCTPIAADQFMNAKRVHDLVIGVTLSIHSASVGEILAAVNDVSYNETYKRNMEYRSRLLRDRPETPTERASFAIESVIKYGGAHLKPRHDLNAIQYMCADIWFFIYAFIFAFGFILYRCIRMIVFRFQSKKPKSD